MVSSIYYKGIDVYPEQYGNNRVNGFCGKTFGLHSFHKHIWSIELQLV